MSSMEDNVPCLWSLICEKFSTLETVYKVNILIIASDEILINAKIDIEFQKDNSTCLYSALHLLLIKKNSDCAV